MSILEKLARSTLVAPPPPPVPPPIPPRVVKIVTEVPIYSEYLVPLSSAQPGDEIVTVTEWLSVDVSLNADRRVVVRYLMAKRKVLVGKNTIITYETIPGTPASIPPSPPAVVTPVPSAWDATAWSIDSITGNLEATWKVGEYTASQRAGTGALVGLAYFAPKAGDEQRCIIHGVRVENGIAYVHVVQPQGVESAPGAIQQETLVPYLEVSDSDEIKVRVENGKVSYYAAGILMATGPSYLGEFPAHLAAVLFNPLDTVVDPELTALADASGGAVFLVVGTGGQNFNGGAALFRITGSGYEEKNRGFIKLHGIGGDRPMGTGTALLKITGHGWGDYVGTGSGSAALAIIGLGGDYEYAFGHNAIVLYGNGSGAAPNTNLPIIAVPEDSLTAETDTRPHGGHYPVVEAESSFDATIITGGSLAADVKASAKMRANYVHSMLLSTGIAAKIDMRSERVIDVSILAEVDADVQQLGVLVITASLEASTEVDAALAPQVIIDAKLGATAEAQFNWSAGMVVNAMFSSLARAGVVMHMPGENLQVWSVNAETNGSTAYEQFPFNSFACIGGRYFGAAPGGIFELVGDDDSGQPIDAVVNLGKRDFGSNVLKGIANAYLTVSSDQVMRVRVTTPEGENYTYEARDAADHMRTQRVDFGRGLRAHYLGLELMNTNGADFDLEAAEFLVTESKRRI